MEQRVEIGVDLEGLARDLQAVTPEQADMEALGMDALAIIYHRTVNEHLDCYGKPFKPYSTHPTWFTEGESDYYNLARKSGGRPSKVGPQIRGKRRKNSDGKRYIFFEGGYAQFHSGLYGDPRPNLQKTGEMMGSGAMDKNAGYGLGQVSAEAVTLDFVRPRERQKAQWNEDNGREFWGIGKRPGEVQLLAEALRERLTARVEQVLNGHAE